MNRKTVGFAMTGSFCTWSRVLPIMEKLSEQYDLIPILSDISYHCDSRFGKAEDWIERIERACKREICRTIETAEPIGPKNLVDAMLVAPCTGNTLAKLALGITDTSVTMACKASLRNGNPLVLAVSTNDALGASARNIGTLLNAKNVYFVPFAQDDPIHKPTSMVACFDKIEETLEMALSGNQIQPMF